MRWERRRKFGITELSHKRISEIEFAAIDFESAGAKKGEIQIGIVVGTIQEGVTDHFTSYIKPKKKVMWQASRIHGITTKSLQDSPSYLSLWPDIKECLTGRVLVAHSCGTEKRFLRTFAGQNFSPWVDSLTLARAALPEQKSHRLGSLLKVARRVIWRRGLILLC